MKNIFLALSSLILSVSYAVPYYWNQIEFSRIMIEGQNAKPYIVRVLTPLIAKGFVAMGAREDVAIILVIALSGTALSFALRYFIQSLWQYDKVETVVIVLLALFVILFENYRKPYDMTTAFFFFTLSLALMVRQKLQAYLMVFALASINRETTILLTGVFALYFYKRMEMSSFLKTVLAQIIIFVAIQSVIRYSFLEVGGSSVWFALEHNIAAYLDSPIRLVIDLGIVAIVLWQVFRKWSYLPIILKTSFLALAPTLVVLYVVCGQAFEYRVFAEAFPATALILIPRP